MTSKRAVHGTASGTNPTEAYVWVWLPGAVHPVVAGRLTRRGTDLTVFAYGRSYLGRPDAIPLYTPELPLRRGVQDPPPGLSVAGCISDAAPDAWGQRVILARHRGPLTRDSDTADLPLLTYLLDSGSDRIGALDFQTSATEYVPRGERATLTELAGSAERLESGKPFSADLDQALLHGSSIGGARPKALLTDGDRRFIAKFSSSGDAYPVVKAEAVGMELARRVGLRVAASEVTVALGHDVLLVERFDRTDVRGERRQIISALTLLGLTELTGRWATYPDLADVIRGRFTDPTATLRELFSRIVLNILISNTDDHARNHAAFWDGRALSLTPAYDLCPQPRSGTEANQALAIDRSGYRESRLQVCVAAAGSYALTASNAQDIVDAQVETIRSQWSDAADAALLTQTERERMWGRQILNPYAFERR